MELQKRGILAGGGDDERWGTEFANKFVRSLSPLLLQSGGRGRGFTVVPDKIVG